jgi:post-segregation antitoxin (ccd killing protein)
MQGENMGKKRLTTMRLDEDLIRKAHDLGLNVSKISENALKDAISRMQGSKTENNGGTNFENRKMDWAGFEPATSALRMRRSCQTELPALFCFGHS